MKKDLKIDNNKKTILYAPTFRGSHLDTRNNDKIFIDFIETLKHRYDNQYNILTKLHLIDHHKDIAIDNVPNHIDTNELLSIVDILITDYSSTAFDFIPLKRPILYYAFDLEEYSQNRGFYFDINEMPGTICRSTDSVIHELDNIDLFMQDYSESYEVLLRNFVNMRMEM